MQPQLRRRALDVAGVIEVGLEREHELLVAAVEQLADAAREIAERGRREGREQAVGAQVVPAGDLRVAVGGGLQRGEGMTVGAHGVAQLLDRLALADVDRAVDDAPERLGQLLAAQRPVGGDDRRRGVPRPRRTARAWWGRGRGSDRRRRATRPRARRRRRSPAAAGGSGRLRGRPRRRLRRPDRRTAGRRSAPARACAGRAGSRPRTAGRSRPRRRRPRASRSPSSSSVGSSISHR